MKNKEQKKYICKKDNNPQCHYPNNKNLKKERREYWWGREGRKE